ncbi:MAG: MBL fold metallo-hydrolase [Bacteroidales bacterium]
MLKYKVFYVNPIRSCSYLVWDETGECAVIDAGYRNACEFSRLVKAVEVDGLKSPSMVLLTHCHFDHVMGLSFLEAQWNPLICYSQRDAYLLQDLPAVCESYYIPGISQPALKNVLHIDDGFNAAFGSTSFQVLSTPGHTPGGLCFYDSADSAVFTGDSLFEGSIGRTDFQGGNCEQLISCLQAKIMVLPTATRVFPGHGYPTTVGQELTSNPYLRQH